MISTHYRTLIASLALVLAGCLIGAAQSAPANPVKADATSIAAGAKLYASNCAPCHGDSGAGDGKMAKQFNPPPANLVDATWSHGSTDGEIFVVIRDGVKDTGMKAFGSKMSAHQLWDVVNYLRSLAPKPDKK
jgi:putative copper resistance protein D